MEVKKYRLQGKHLFMTYAQTKVEKESVLEQLKEKLKPREIRKYIIVKEEHKEEGEHIHVYVELDKRCNIISSKRLDIEDVEGKKRHGKYESCRNYSRVVRYVIKERNKENILTNMELDDNGRERNVWMEVINIVERGEVEEGLEIIKDIASRNYVLDYKKIKGNLEKMKKDMSIRNREERVYDERSYELPEELKEWLEDGTERRTLYVTGASGIGKTEAIKSVLIKKYGKKNVLRVTNWEGLKRISERDYKAIILDDVNMDGKKVEEKIGIIDVENDVDVRVLYGVERIKAGTSRAIISNKSCRRYFAGEEVIEREQWNAIKRRLKEIDLKGRRLIVRRIEEIEVVES